MVTSRPWFVARRRFGWGWRPSTWQGWLVTAVYLAAVLGCSTRLQQNAALLAILALTGLMLGCVVLTGTKPGGRLF